MEILSKMFNENCPIEMKLDEDDEDDDYENESEPTELHLHQNTVFEIIKPAALERNPHLM